MTGAVDTQQYLLEEVKSARSRIDQEISSMNSNEALNITYIAAIYLAYFQFKITDHWFLRLLSVLPVGIAMYGLVRYNAQRHVINIHESYIKSAEDKIRLSQSDFRGLMTYYDAQKRSKLKYARWMLWGSLVIFTIIFSGAAFCYPEWISSIHKTEKQ
ncbi:MAG: hypothetical protein PGN34_05860 [Methylobacterium frigidaeris]